VFHPHNAIDCTEAEWDATVDSSLKGAWRMSKYALPTMIAQGRGVIIHQASGWGIQGGDLAVAYCAAKGGVVVMTKAMAIDHGKQGIRVNCLCPGDVERRCRLRRRGPARATRVHEGRRQSSARPGRHPESWRARRSLLASDDSSFGRPARR
jgi:NAD(P)-dependent dehydrogenase (short-subunit alcohol dehydrogenase family)